MSRISVEPHPSAGSDRALVRVREVSTPPLDVRIKLEWAGEGKIVGPYGWQGADHFLRPRESRQEGSDLLLEVGADVAGLIEPGTPIEVEIPRLDLSERITWPDLAAGQAAATPQSPSPPPSPAPTQVQKDARTFDQPPQPPAPAPAPTAPPPPRTAGRRAPALLAGLVVGLLIGAAAAYLFLPERTVTVGPTAKDVDARVAQSQAELKAAQRRADRLEAEAGDLRRELDQLRQSQTEPSSNADPAELAEERLIRAETERLAEDRLQQIMQLEREITVLKDKIAQLQVNPAPAIETPQALDPAQVDWALAKISRLYNFEPAILDDVRAQLLAGADVREITGSLSDRLPSTARQSLFNQLCAEFPSRCTSP